MDEARIARLRAALTAEAAAWAVLAPGTVLRRTCAVGLPEVRRRERAAPHLV